MGVDLVQNPFPEKRYEYGEENKEADWCDKVTCHGKIQTESVKKAQEHGAGREAFGFIEVVDQKNEPGQLKEQYPEQSISQ
jgi:hypothetical protein